MLSFTKECINTFLLVSAAEVAFSMWFEPFPSNPESWPHGKLYSMGCKQKHGSQ